MSHVISYCFGRSRETECSMIEQCRLTSEEKQACLNLTDLPRESFIHNIFPHVTYRDLCALRQVNKLFHMLIDNSDELWENVIKNEKLDVLPSNSDDCELTVFEGKKSKLKFLIEQRRTQSWTSVTEISTYRREDNCNNSISHKCATTRSLIKTIKKEEPNDELHIYFIDGKPQNNFTAESADYCSTFVVHRPQIESNTFSNKDSTHIKCLKCQSKFYYPVCSALQPKPYNWYISSFRDIEIIEIYCEKCKRFSLWKNRHEGKNTSYFERRTLHYC